MSDDAQGTHDLFGDESYGNGIFAYAFIVVPSSAVDSATQAIADAKTRCGKSPADKLHCREMFTPAAKAKTVWADVPLHDLVKLYTEIFIAIEKLKARKIVVTSKVAQLPIKVEAGPWKHKDDPAFIGPPNMMPGFEITDKFIAAFSGRLALSELAKELDLSKARVWTDPDTTKIALAGQKRQAGRLVGGPVAGPNGWLEVKLMNTDGVKPPLIEVADSVAYFARRHLAGGQAAIDKYISSLNSLINPQLMDTTWQFQ